MKSPFCLLINNSFSERYYITLPSAMKPKGIMVESDSSERKPGLTESVTLQIKISFRIHLPAGQSQKKRGKSSATSQIMMAFDFILIGRQQLFLQYVAQVLRTNYELSERKGKQEKK